MDPFGTIMSAVKAAIEWWSGKMTADANEGVDL